MTIISFFLYIFYFLIIFGGAIAVLVLTINGVFYLTSGGNPERLKKIRSRILSAILGIIILLSSWIILNTINPELIKPRIAQLEKHLITPIESIIPTYNPAAASLTRIKEIAESVKKMPEEIKKVAIEIKSLTDRCACPQSSCLCSGGSENSSCEPLQCYGDPCPNTEEIKKLQKTLVDWRDAILYYRNRISSDKNPTEDDPIVDEITDLQANIKLEVNPKIKYYEDSIATESLKEAPNEQFIVFWQEKLNELIKEKNYKQALIEKLTKLSEQIAKIEEPINQMVKLPDDCLSNINKKCAPVCKTGSEYGCHNTTAGCQPDACQPIDPNNPNPCPIKELEKQILTIKEAESQIIKLSDEIINIINQI